MFVRMNLPRTANLRLEKVRALFPSIRDNRDTKSVQAEHVALTSSIFTASWRSTGPPASPKDPENTDSGVRVNDMSLLRDTDFLIHRLRLAYLRNVEDPFGPRVISLDPAYHHNPYVVAASLADHERWPELGLPASPNLSENEEGMKPQPSRKGRLRHSKLLNAPHTGSSSGHTSNQTLTDTTPKAAPDDQPLHEDEMRNFIAGNAPVQVEEALTTAVSSMVPTVNITAPPPQLRMGSWIDIDKDDEDEVESPIVKVKVQEPSAPVEAPVAKVVQFIPKFKGAAEMEARRRLRMAARRGPQALAPQPARPLTVDTSSEEDDMLSDDSSSSSSSDEFEHVGLAVTDLVDEFDPDFAATRTSAVSDSTSEYVVSADASSHAPPPSPSAHRDAKTGGRFHPTAGHPNRHARHHHHHHHHHSHDGTKAEDAARGKRPDASPSRSNDDSNMFAKKKVVPLSAASRGPAPRSALSAKLAGSNAANPFAELYSMISGRGASAARTVQVYFPHAEQPRHKPLELSVRADATVEEVIGFSLWSYWEERWLPKLDEGVNGENDPKWKIKLSTVGWVLRMAEDDGEIDDDCPAPDRAKKAKEFLDIYAIVEATPAQVQQNQLFESQMQRRPTANLSVKKAEKLDQPSTTPMSSLNLASFAGAGSMLSSSPGLSSSHGPQVLLRVHTADAIQILTTIKVFSGTYMQEALELVCRRQRIDNPVDYALLLADKSLVIPLDRTVASLQGKRELSLVRKSMLPSLGLKNVGKTTDPNASIFTKPKRLSENNDAELSKLDFTAAYKKYTIYRKIPMLVTRQERTLAIDGDYIHIMPSANKARAVFDNGKTASYHITTVANCSQSSKNSSLFKLILMRAATSPPKRYDFEAESPKLAADIVASIRNLKAALDRNGTMNKSRRSRHIV